MLHRVIKEISLSGLDSQHILIDNLISSRSRIFQNIYQIPTYLDWMPNRESVMKMWELLFLSYVP